MKQIYISIFFIVSFVSFSSAQNEFITTWQTTTANESIAIPTTGSGYNYDIDWGDGITEKDITGDAVHAYATANTYTVTITGDFPRIYFEKFTFIDSNKIQSIVQWGSQQWTSMEGAFKGCSNIVIDATDAPDLSQAISLKEMFSGANRFNDNGGNIGNWNVSTIQIMDGMFHGSSFVENINTWNVSQVKSINNMFQACEDFNQPLDQWDTSSLESAVETFADAKSFDQSLGDWDISNVSDFTNIFTSGTGLLDENYDATLIGWATLESGETQIPANVPLDAGTMYCLGAVARNTLTGAPYNWTITDGGFGGCDFTDAFQFTWQANDTGKIISIPTTGNGFNYTIYWGDGSAESKTSGNPSHTYTTNGTYTISIVGDFPRFSFDTDFNSATRVQAIKQWGTIAWDTMELAFSQCNNLVIDATDTPDFSNVSTTFRMFLDNTNLVDNGGAIGSWNMSAIENLSRMFEGCSNFNENINNWTVTGVKNMEGMFKECTKFNQPLNNWNTGLVEDMGLLFNEASKFNQDISAWNVISAKDMIRMFEKASDFNQNLSNWNISNLRGGSTMVNMFTDTSLSQENYDRTLIGWATAQPGGVVTPPTVVPINITLNADTTYCLGEAARNTLVNDFGWMITDDGLASGCATTDFFITTWSITSNNEEIALPIVDTGLDFTVDWGDGIITNETEEAYHTYANAGTYTIRISGNFNQIRFNGNADSRKIQTIEQWGSNKWTSMESAFKGCGSLEINATDAPDLSDATSMDSMFEDGSCVDNGGNIGNWNVSTISSMNSMFRNAYMNENINTWNVSSVRSIDYMFQACEDFNYPLDQWNTSNLESAIEIFADAKSFDQSLGDWDISNVSDLTNVFTNGTSISEGNYDATLIGWATLENGESLTPNVNLGAGDLTYCFGEAARNILTSAPYNWVITDGGSSCTVTDFFITTWQTTTTDESITVPASGNYTIDWGDGSVESITSGNAIHVYETPGIYTVKVSSNFNGFRSNSISRDKLLTVEQWGIKKWTSMRDAFSGCVNLKLNATDLPDFSLVTSTRAMFEDCTNLEDLQNNIGNWDMSTIKTIDKMFEKCSLFNEAIGTWNFTVLEGCNLTFNNAIAFNQNISNWDVSKVDEFSDMFSGATSFNQPLNWTFGTVDYMDSMFENATQFNQDISSWNMENVYDIQSMFEGATAFNQDLSAWDISNIEAFEDFFTGTAMSQDNYDKTLIGWATLEVGETEIPTNLTLNADASYCLAETAHATLTSAPYNWTINDGGLGCDFTNAFITTWETTVTNESITIPTTGNGYYYAVDWGDGTLDIGITGDAVHSYTTAGTYIVKITGDFPRIYFNNTGDTDKIQSVTQWGMQQWTSMEAAFYGCTNIIIEADDTPNLINVTSLSAMFKSAINLIDTKGQISNWDVRTIIDLSQLFMDAEKFNTSLNKWRFFAAEDLSEMFRGAKAFNQPLGRSPSQAKTLEGMFRDATAFNQPVNWYIPFVTNLKDMFNGATSFDQNLGYLTIPLVTTMEGMFTNAGLSTENYDQTLSGWYVELNSTDIRPENINFDAGSSRYCMAGDIIEKLENDHGWQITDSGASCDESDFFIMTWDLTTETSFVMPTSGDGYDYLFSLPNGSIYHQTSDVFQVGYPDELGVFTVRIYGDFPRFDFDAQFVEKEKLIAIEQWGNLQLSEATGAFEGCTNLKLNATDIPDLSQVTFIDSMFKGTTSFVDNEGSMNSWNVSNVISMVSLFEASGFNENINNWNVSNVQTMGNMFQDNTAFNQPLNQWVPQNVSDFEHMFHGATAFNQPIGNWNIISANSFESMFEGATAFDQDLSGWDISSTDRLGMVNMFIGSGLSQENYDNTLIGWSILETGETQIPVNLTLDADATYCLGEQARNTLTSAPYNWTITDGGAGCLTPVITLLGDNPQAIELGNVYTELGAEVTYGATLSINATAVNINQLGNYTVTYDATSASGAIANQVTRTVNVVDTTNPLVVCQNITVQLDASGNVSITTAQVDNGTTDISGIASLMLDITDFDCSHIGDNMVTLTAVDNNGNSDTCITTVIVEDSLDPVFDTTTLPGDIVVGFTNDDMYTLADFTVGVVATDNCDTGRSILINTITQDPIPGTLLGIGDHIITLSVEDANANVATATFTLTVSDDVLSVDENDKQGFAIYPNPAKDQFQISGLSDNAEVSIYDMNGRSLKTIQVVNSQFISIQDLPVGVYFVRIIQNTIYQTIKLIKN